MPFSSPPGTGPRTGLSGSHIGSRLVNTTGVDVHVLTVDLREVDVAVSGTSQLAIYSELGGLPYELMAVSDTRSSLSVGTNTYTFPDTATILAGDPCWVFYRGPEVQMLNSSLTKGARFRNRQDSSAFEEFMRYVGFVNRVLPVTIYEGGVPVSSDVRVSLSVIEPVAEGTPNVRVNEVTVDPLTEGYSAIRVNMHQVDPLTEGYSAIRISLFVVESLQPVEPEPFMSTIPFPGFGSDPTDPFFTPLPGLAFSVYKTPMFKTNIQEAATGNEVRTALAEYPRWDFKLSYEFLEDRTGAESSLKTILGFFLARRGSWDSWLFKDPDDYEVTNGYCGDSDGVTTEFPFLRGIGEFYERIGQVDTTKTLNVYLMLDGEAQTIPNVGPFTITVTNAATFQEDGGVTKSGIPMTKVTGAPAAGQYAVSSGGIYTFHSSDSNDAVLISYRYTVDPADYTVTMPNRLIFDTAPVAGIVSADFQFYFVCRFLEDAMEFEKFSDQLWSLQECAFRSLVQ